MLAACGQSESGEQAGDPAAPGEEISATRSADPGIPCALDGAADFTPVCTIERNGDIITVRNPDGGFHRLVVAADGSVTAADGAEPAQSTTAGETIEVTIGGDRYRLPPTS